MILTVKKRILEDIGPFLVRLFLLALICLLLPVTEELG